MLQADSVARWARQLDALHARIAPHFARPEPRRRARAYLQTVLAGADRRNGWQLAEADGEATPSGMQRLIASATWDADAVRDDLRADVAELLGAPDRLLIVDETGFLRKAIPPPASTASTAAPPVASRTARWACSSPTPADGGTR